MTPFRPEKKMGLNLSRRTFNRCFLTGTLGATLSAGSKHQYRSKTRPNVLLITADDLQYDSLGITGCKIPGITPAIDKLAREGMLFEHAHVNIAVCQPCRSVLMTGRYPGRNGAEGFQPIRPDVPTLQEQLRRAGYLNGIMAKVPHLAPQRKFCWDFVVRARDLGVGRDPKKYYRYAKKFFEKAKAEGRNFFLMANSQDPHRPFAGSAQERRAERRWSKSGKRIFPPASRYYKPEEVEVPGFLPDLPDIRLEIAQYYTSVHRCDEIVGAVLRALQESGLAQNTIVMFLSDNGMAFPFAKTNVWRASTRTPWIVRWPGVVKPASIDQRHFISTIDFMPTVLEAVGLKQVEGMDGRSFLPLLRGGEQEDRDMVFTVFHKTAAGRSYPMRSVQTRKFGYIYNAWSDGKTVFRNESQSGLTFRAMQRAAKRDPRIKARVNFFLYRVKEELYDYENDPNALHNLIDDPRYRPVVRRLRKALAEFLRRIGDPLAADIPESQ